MTTYKDVIESKKNKVILSGFDVSDNWSWLFPFQRHCVKKALKHGRYALFEGCGLGKTRQQLTWAFEVVSYTEKPVLILAPLSIVDQTIAEGKKIGIIPISYGEIQYKELPTKGKRRIINTSTGTKIVDKWQLVDDEILIPNKVLENKIYITNYDQLDNIDCSQFSGIVLDESSILKNFTGATKKALIEAFKTTPYKLCCTATPSPNDLNEIGNHSEFLNILDAQDMRAKWFVRDEGMNNYRLKGHAKADFYAWMSTWCMMFAKPADIGFEMKGYDLPPVNYEQIVIVSENRAVGKLFNEGHVNATSFHREVKLTMTDRLKAIADIVNASQESFIIWIEQNAEGDALLNLIPGAVEVRGSDNSKLKKERLLGFANDEFRVLITKGEIAGFGMNYQNSHNMIFANPSFSFETIYQCICRQVRFGQKFQVNIWMVSSDTMENVISKYKQKEKQFFDMLQEMN